MSAAFDMQQFTVRTSNVPDVMPTTLEELLQAARKMKESGENQEEIIDFVRVVVGRYGIRVRHDQYDAVEGTSPSTVPTEETPTEETPSEAPTEETPSVVSTEETPSEAPSETLRRVGKGQRRRDANKKPQTLSAPVIRRRDGTHHLNLGQLFEPEYKNEEHEDQPDRKIIVGRIVLSVEKRNQKASLERYIPLRQECNGVVIDARTWRALVIPPSSFNPFPTTKVVDSYLAEDLYDVIRVDDGTVVTLYCWDHPEDGPVWALASSNGYDVSSLCWIGQITYAGVFHDLATRIYPEFVTVTGMTLKTAVDGSTHLEFANLDRSRCYTVGFRHHNFHPLEFDPERMWQIQSTDLSGESPVVIFSPDDESTGLPVIPKQNVCQDLAELAAKAIALESKDEEQPKGGVLTFKLLQALGSDAFSRATDYIADLAHRKVSQPDTNVLPEEINYGFILRSKNPAITGEYSDILVETYLLTRIRKIVYERAPRSVRDNLTPDDRLEYNAMRAYLTANSREEFLALYPQWVRQYQIYEEFVNNVIQTIIHATRQRAMTPASRVPALKSATGQVASALLNHISRYERITPFHKETESIVRDYVVNPEYAYLFLNAIRSKANAKASTSK